MSRQLGVFSMKSHKDVLTAQSYKAASTVCTSKGDPGELGTKVSMKAVFLSLYTFAQKKKMNPYF